MHAYTHPLILHSYAHPEMYTRIHSHTHACDYRQAGPHGSARHQSRTPALLGIPWDMGVYVLMFVTIVDRKHLKTCVFDEILRMLEPGWVAKCKCEISVRMYIGGCWGGRPLGVMDRCTPRRGHKNRTSRKPLQQVFFWGGAIEFFRARPDDRDVYFPGCD